MYLPQFRKKNNNIPILSKVEIDTIAEGFVHNFCPEALHTPQPLNVDLFIEEYLGLTLDYQYLSNDARFLGMTVFNDTPRVVVFLPEENCAEYLFASAGTVIIDNTLTEKRQVNRYRYTCGHEAGHWIFHRDYYNYNPNQMTLFGSDNPFVQCREITINDYSRDTRTWDDDKWMEWHADKFSSCFLMPRIAVHNLVGNTKITDDNRFEIIMSTSNTFQVSFEAATYRLMDLGIIKSKTEHEQQSFE